jgi:FkbM family methyltransferase
MALDVHATLPRVRLASAWLRKLPPAFPGKLRLARFLLGDAQRARDVELDDADGNHFLVPHLSEPMALHLLANGVYEPETRAAILPHLGGDAILVDVGANIGLFTIPAARKCQVLAIEASPVLFGYLQANVARNGLENVQLVHAAATERDGDTVRFYEAPPAKFGMGSLVPRFGGASVQVLTRTVDSLLSPEQAARVRALKVDVEGFEAQVLRGATGLLTQETPPMVVFEFADWAEEDAAQVGTAQLVLREFGFKIWRLQDWQQGRDPLETPLTRGDAMLVAVKS